MFHDDLQRFLRRAEKEPARTAVSYAEIRSWFLRSLDGVEESLRRKLFERWNGKLAGFVEFAERAAALPPEELIRAALRLEMGIAEDVGSVLSLEAERILRVFERRSTSSTDLRVYARENSILAPDGVTPTSIGRTLLQLTGRDAIRWLLLIETERSVGAYDPWRAHDRLLREAQQRDGIEVSYDDDGEPWFGFDESTLSRLVQMGVLLRRVDSPDGETYAFVVRDDIRSLVTTVLDDDPWRQIVRAQLNDETHAVLGVMSAETLPLAEQSRIVTHEIRNALVPARHNLEQVLAAGGSNSRLEKSLKGVNRVLKFVDDLSSIAEKTDSVRLSTQLVALVQEAAGVLDGSERVSLVSQDAALVLPREPLTRAVRNVIQNALQASDAEVEVSWHVEQDVLTVLVDDAGPGVPMSNRERIFEDGFTTKQGGTGFGLAMTRSVLRQLGGSVKCVESPLGGARFVLAVPLEDPAS